MEFHIKNNYIKKFLSKYSNQNELKVLKYLTIVGIHYLETQYQDGIAYSELKRLAKEIASVVPKEDKQLNHELKIIKDELARLNEKFEDKLRTLPGQPEIFQPEKNQLLRSASVPRKMENFIPQDFSKLPSSQWRLGDQGSPERGRRLRTQEYSPGIKLKNYSYFLEKRANSGEPTIHPAWWGHGPDIEPKRRSSLTPKPTQTIPFIPEKRENRRLLPTKHHLDDSESRLAMNDGGVMHFPKKEDERKIPHQQNNLKPPVPERIEKPERYERVERPDRLHGRIDALERPRSRSGDKQVPMTFTKPEPLGENDYRIRRDYHSPQNNTKKSPQFAQNREDIMRNMIVASQSNNNRENQPIAANTGKFGYVHVPIEEHHSKNKASPVKNSKKAPTKKSNQQKPSRDRSRAKNYRTGLNQTHVCDLKNVSSKIRDDINYHKELSKQYKRMKQNLHHYDGYVDVIDASQDLNKDKFELVEPNRPYPAQYYRNLRNQVSQPQSRQNRQSQLAESGKSQDYQDNSKLLESVSSAQRSLNIGSYANQYDRTPPNHSTSGIRAARERNEDFSNYKQSGETQAGGMLDIANSFLNSPLMHHLSNMDNQNSEISSKESSNPNTLKKNYSNVRVNNFDPKSPNGFTKSPNTRYDNEEESKIMEGRHQHKYSDWVGSYKIDNRNEHSNLKDSSNRRYGEYPSKDSRSIFNKDNDGSSSLTSSNFSNFLNEEMKGFYQKETFDLKKSKNSRSMRHAGSSDHSSNISFNHGHEAQPTPGDHAHFHSRKSTYMNAFDNNKSYVGTSYDNGNIFKHERMSVTRLLNNTNY